MMNHALHDVTHHYLDTRVDHVKLMVCQEWRVHHWQKNWKERASSLQKQMSKVNHIYTNNQQWCAHSWSIFDMEHDWRPWLKRIRRRRSRGKFVRRWSRGLMTTTLISRISMQSIPGWGGNIGLWKDQLNILVLFKMFLLWKETLQCPEMYGSSWEVTNVINHHILQTNH